MVVSIACYNICRCWCQEPAAVVAQETEAASKERIEQTEGDGQVTQHRHTSSSVSQITEVVNSELVW